VAAKTTLNTKNLEALGAERLAELLIEISAGNAAAKRRLRLELAGAQSPGELAKEVRKRITAMARSRSFVDCKASEPSRTTSIPNGGQSSRGWPRRTRRKPSTCSGGS